MNTSKKLENTMKILLEELKERIDAETVIMDQETHYKLWTKT